MSINIKAVVAARRVSVSDNVVIVCGNKGYTITFTFDDEWAGASAKTARFRYMTDAGLQHQDVTFSGDTVEVPVLTGIREVKVGVFSDNMRTTTGAAIRCHPSILCGDSAEATPGTDGTSTPQGPTHSHDNKETIDGIGEADGKLTYNGAKYQTEEDLQKLADDVIGSVSSDVQTTTQELYDTINGIDGAWQEKVVEIDGNIENLYGGVNSVSNRLYENMLFIEHEMLPEYYRKDELNRILGNYVDDVAELIDENLELLGGAEDE